MKNKWLRKGALLLTISCLAFSMTGCKGEQVLDKVLEKADSNAKTEETAAEEKTEEPEVDVAKPELVTNLSGSITYKVGAQAEALKVEASSADGGVITYQWYKSLTNTNGGGTVIEGATQSTYIPPTTEASTVYYYAVAISTIGNSDNRITTDTVEIIVSDEAEQAAEGEEQPAENAGEAKAEEKPEEKSADEKAAESKEAENKEAEKPAENQATEGQPAQ